MYPALLAVALGAFPGGQEPWWSLPELRRLLNGAGTTAIAHWAGPDSAHPEAAFLALHSPGAGVRSIVALNPDSRIRFSGGKLEIEAPHKSAVIDSLDMEGVTVGNYAVLFHAESGLIRSAFSFDTGPLSQVELQFLVCGVAPGVWEVWRNGWVIDPGVVVRPREAVLQFKERPGSYFIRRLT